jgi:hypothetical protein
MTQNRQLVYKSIIISPMHFYSVPYILFNHFTNYYSTLLLSFLHKICSMFQGEVRFRVFFLHFFFFCNICLLQTMIDRVRCRSQHNDEAVNRKILNFI